MREREHWSATARRLAGIGLLLLATAGHAAAQEREQLRLPEEAAPATPRPPAQQYVAAYDSMAEANWLKNEGLLEDALAFYTEAFNLFRRLAGEHPQWETNLVAFRIQHCAREMAGLQPARPATPPATASGAAPAAAENTPDPAPIRERLGAALPLERAGDSRRALAGYLAVLEADPQNIPALRGAARCYLRQGLTGAARDLLLPALTLPGADAELHLLAGMIYCQAGEFYKAYQLLLIALDFQPGNAHANLAMGVALAGLNKIKEARDFTHKAARLNPDLGDAHYNLARLTFRLNPDKPEAAREYYRIALRHGAAADSDFDRQLP